MKSRPYVTDVFEVIIKSLSFINEYISMCLFSFAIIGYLYSKKQKDYFSNHYGIQIQKVI